MQLFRKVLSGMANSVDSDQTASEEIMVMTFTVHLIYIAQNNLSNLLVQIKRYLGDTIFILTIGTA